MKFGLVQLLNCHTAISNLAHSICFIALGAFPISPFLALWCRIDYLFFLHFSFSYDLCTQIMVSS